MSLQKQVLQPPMDKQTELMLKHGPKDTCWAANWGEKDQPLLEKYFTKAATLGRENNPMIIEFFDCLERAWNDHTGSLTVQNGTTLSVVDIAKTKDIPTIQGLQYTVRLMMFIVVSPRWRYHGVGDSTIEPRAYQQRLYGETEPRADMGLAPQGSCSVVNQSMRFVGIFPTSFPTLTVRESAVFTNNTGYTAGVMLNRQVFGSNPINHTVNGGPFTVATDINFTAVTTWG